MLLRPVALLDLFAQGFVPHGALARRLLLGTSIAGIRETAGRRAKPAIIRFTEDRPISAPRVLHVCLGKSSPVRCSTPPGS